MRRCALIGTPRGRLGARRGKIMANFLKKCGKCSRNVIDILSSMTSSAVTEIH
jgi:hypothetical protein